jgi:hypothetical protein
VDLEADVNEMLILLDKVYNPLLLLVDLAIEGALLRVPNRLLLVAVVVELGRWEIPLFKMEALEKEETELICQSFFLIEAQTLLTLQQEFVVGLLVAEVGATDQVVQETT